MRFQVTSGKPLPYGRGSEGIKNYRAATVRERFLKMGGIAAPIIAAALLAVPCACSRGVQRTSEVVAIPAAKLSLEPGDSSWSSAPEYLTQTDPEKAKRIWREYPLDDYGKGWDDAEM